MDQDVGIMSARIMIILSDDVERMCELFEINAQSFMVDSLQQEIHAKAVVRACTRFNDANNTRVF